MKKLMLMIITFMLVLSGCSYDINPDKKDEERKPYHIEETNFYTNKRLSLSLGGLTPKKFYDKYIESKKKIT